jgi:DivIVA domain-containing protein
VDAAVLAGPDAEGPPAFRVVRRGYDRDQVDAAFSQLAARLQQALDQHAKGEQVQAALQREVTSLQQRSPSFEDLGGEAAAVLQEAGRSAEQLVDNARRRADTIYARHTRAAAEPCWSILTCLISCWPTRTWSR